MERERRLNAPSPCTHARALDPGLPAQSDSPPITAGNTQSRSGSVQEYVGLPGRGSLCTTLLAAAVRCPELHARPAIVRLWEESVAGLMGEPAEGAVGPSAYTTVPPGGDVGWGAGGADLDAAIAAVQGASPDLLAGALEVGKRTRGWDWLCWGRGGERVCGGVGDGACGWPTPGHSEGLRAPAFFVPG